MTRAFGLAALTVLELPPPQQVAAAAQAGYSHVGLRLIPVAGQTLPSFDERELERQLAETGVGVLDVEVFRLTPETEVGGFEPVIATAARLRATQLLVHGADANEARLTDTFARLCELAAVGALWLLQKPDDYFDVAWRREPGGGPLLINCIHDIDDLRFVCGDIVEVRAMTSSLMRNFQVEDTAALTLRFANGALGSVTVSDAVAAPWSWELASGENPAYPQQRENCYFFSGRQGSLALPSVYMYSYEGKKGWTAPLSMKKLSATKEDPQVRQLQHFCRVIRGEEKPRITGEDAMRTLAVTLAAHKAARSGSPVFL